MLSEELWEPLKSNSQLKEGLFRKQVRDFLVHDCGVLDVVRYEIHGRGYADMQVLPIGKPVFFIEFKGETRYGTQKQEHQDAFKSRYEDAGYVVIKLTPNDDWQSILEDLTRNDNGVG